MKQETRDQTRLGVGAALLVLCCAAGPAIIGAIGGSLSRNVLVGAGIAAAIAAGVFYFMRRRSGSEAC